MKNADRWFILIGLLYRAFGFAFGIWRHQRALRPGASACPYQSRRLGVDGAVRAALSRLSGARQEPISRHFALYNLGAIVFLIGIPLAQAHQTVVLAAGGSLLVLVGILTFLANYYLNEFSQPTASAREKA
jgi:hypothetical protein